MENLNMDVILRYFFCLTNASNLNKNTEDFQNLDKKTYFSIIMLYL